MTTPDEGLRSAPTAWALEGMTLGLFLWVMVSAGLAWTDDSPSTVVGVWLLLFLIGLVPAVGFAGVTGILVAVCARSHPSSDHRQQHIRTVRLLIPVVLAGISILFVLSAAVSGRDGGQWWPAVALIALAMGIPATLVGWWRAPTVVNKYWSEDVGPPGE